MCVVHDYSPGINHGSEEGGQRDAVEDRALLCVPSGAPCAALLTARFRAGISLLAYLPHSDRNQLNGGGVRGGWERGGGREREMGREGIGSSLRHAVSQCTNVNSS